MIACDSYAGAPAMQVADECGVFSMLDGDYGFHNNFSFCNNDSKRVIFRRPDARETGVYK